MRVCVVGCGAVGSLFAASLASLHDVEVWAYDVSREHVLAITRRGLRLTGRRELTTRLTATFDAAELPPCDFAIVPPEAGAGEAALATTSRAFERGAVVAVSTEAEASLVAPGVVSVESHGETTLEPFAGSPASYEQMERLADACTRAGLPTEVVRT